jgi:GAF domain-containing protein
MAPDPQPLPVLATEPPPEAAVPTPEVEPQPAPLMPPEPDLDAIAQLCTDFGRFDDLGHVRPLVETAAGLLGAVGLIVWVWDARVNELIPVLTHGYSDYVLSLVPKVRRESDNATAAAFRTAQTCVVSGSEHASGALVVPMMVPDGCIGVLAIELRDQAEHRPSVRSLATIVASQLTRLIDASRLLALADRRLA